MSQLIFNRHELKYIIDWKMYNKLIKQIAPFTNPDKFSLQSGNYSILSLYYDTANFDAYYSKIDGQKIRQKLRIRWYLLDNGNDVSYLELKKKYINQILKRRLAIDTKNVDKFLEGLYPPEKICKNEKELGIAKEILYYYELMESKPKLYVHYFREAYFGKFENRLRITFDKKISAVRWHRREFMFGKKRYIFNPFYMVMEVKFFNSMPIWLINVVNSNNLVERRISKYCMSVEVTDILRLNLKEEM